MNKNNQTLIALLTGAAIGTVVGMLLAPDTGSNTRKNISQKAKKLQEDLKHQSDSLISVIDEVKHAANDALNTLKKTGYGTATNGTSGNGGSSGSSGTTGSTGKSKGDEGNQ